MSNPPIRFIGSRELHRDLPKVLNNLDESDARYVLTIHSKPKAVLIGAESFLKLLQGQDTGDRMLALQLQAIVQSFGGSGAETATGPEPDRPTASSEAPARDSNGMTPPDGDGARTPAETGRDDEAHSSNGTCRPARVKRTSRRRVNGKSRAKSLTTGASV